MMDRELVEATDDARAEPQSARPPSDLDAQVRACTMAGDNLCITRLLEGRADTEWRLSTLIEAYRALGQTARSLVHMRTFVDRFGSSPRANPYRAILASHGAP
ncbi:MAG: hypothetical protein M5U28_42705 [Sandaracinaceae bacterium]|nr:hypothetical protein [Sandaracinaceae bacterium]